MTAWDLPPPSARDELRAQGSGRYSLTLVDSDAGDFEEVCQCVACDELSTASVFGCMGWLILRRRNGTTLALCTECADTCETPRRNRR